MKLRTSFAGGQPDAASSEPLWRRGYRRIAPFYSPSNPRELNRKEAAITAAASVVMVGVLIALIYVVHLTYRYAQGL
jgi:hypothetical protein